ncbi:MAG: DUF6206 family protein [Candidatus Heimdallarchaeota archaeon]
MTLTVDVELLREFEEHLNPAKPEESSISARVLGYGEMTTVFEIPDISSEEIAFKRMPLFDDQTQINDYVALYNRYNELLQDKIGIQVPEYGAQEVVTEKGRLVLYLFQRKVPASSVCHHIIREADDKAVTALVVRVLRELNKVWEFNQKNRPETQVGFDGQISNWVANSYGAEDTDITEITDLSYLDTSTPLIRDSGIEQLNALLFLKPAPPILRWILKKRYLQEILDRYYDLRLVVTDIIANFYKEKREELIPSLIPVANDFFANKAAIPALLPITEHEVQAYYKDDASTWKLYLRARRLHRFIKGKILRRYYPFILPGKIER